MINFFLKFKTFLFGPAVGWWVSIVLSSSIFTACDTLSKIWADGGKWSRYALILLCLLAPLGYILFGIVTKRSGLAVASVLVNSFLVIGTVLMGLVVMREWDKVSFLQYIGLVFAILGIILLLFFPKESY